MPSAAAALPSRCRPGLTDARMPVAFQFAAPHLGEVKLVRAGYALQRTTDWHRAHPALVA